MKLFIKEKKMSSTERLLTDVGSKLAQYGNPLNSFKDRLFSAESMSDSDRAEMEGDIQTLNTELQTVINDVADENQTEYDENQREAAVTAALASNSRRELFERIESQDVPKGITVMPVNSSVSGEADVGRMREALEAYDNTDNRTNMTFSMAYNLKAARQDETAETLFPTIVVPADNSIIMVEADLLNVLEEQKHMVDGSYKYQFARKSLVAAMVYPDILHNDTTRMYPVVRSGNPDNVKRFVAATDVAPRNVLLENGISIPTAPIKVGVEFNMIGLCSPDYLIQQGVFDQTDAIDSSITLNTIYLKLKNNDVIAFNHLDVLPSSTFTPAYQGNDKVMQLNYNERANLVTDQTTKVDGSALAINVVTAHHTVKLALNLKAEINIETGLFSSSASEVVVESVYDNTSTKLDLTAGLGKTTADDFADAKIIGFELTMRRVNSNRRERGQLLDVNRERMAYSLPILAPVSVIRPTSNTTEQDAVSLDRLVTTTYVRCSQAAISTLISTAEYLSQIRGDLSPEELYANSALGIARYYVNPWYKKDTLDVANELNTLKTSERIVDVQQVLVNTIREFAFRAYIESNYFAASSVLQGDINKKPLVIVATDMYIAAYLMVTGDLRTLGDEFDLKVVASPNKRMRDKIFITFGKNGGGNDQVNPLHFGNMFFRPELTSILQITRNNSTSMELTVQPSFRHVVHLPILGEINVTNLPKAVTKMAPIFTKSVP